MVLIFISLLFSGKDTNLATQMGRLNDYKISLTQLAEDIELQKVKRITEQGNRLSIEYKDSDKKKITYKEQDASLTQTLVNLGVSEDNLRKVEIVSSGESFLKIFFFGVVPTLLPFLVVLFLFWSLFSQASKGQMQAFNFIRSRARIFKPDNKKDKVGFDDIGGLDEAKEELKEVVDFLKFPDKFLKIGAKIPKGVLLVGSPGTGKTLIARAVANEAGVPFFHISGSEFVELFVGVGASRVRSTFELAKRSAPSILFIDELDAIGRHRGAGIGGGHDEREQTLNQILVEMDGFDKDTKVVVIAATNRPDILDPALLRPGRFDRRIVLDRPDIKAREKILKIHCSNKPLAKDVDISKIAQRTAGFSGADLENLANEAAILAARKNRKEIKQEDFYMAVEKILLGPERKTHVLSLREKKIAAIHEAGHALVAHFHPYADPVHKVSIISRGMAGGFTLALPSEDKYFRSRKEFEADLAVSLGGYAAEKIIFKDITTGASNDLRRVTELARKIVMRYGMGGSLPPMVFGHREELIFLGKEIHEEKTYSEKVATMIDEEIEKFVRRSYMRAVKILKRKINLLKKIANELMEKETLEKEEFLKLVEVKA